MALPKNIEYMTPARFEEQRKRFDTWFESIFPEYLKYGLYIERKTAVYKESPSGCYVSLATPSENFMVSISLAPGMDLIELMYNDGAELNQIGFPVYEGDGLFEVHKILMKEIPRLYNQPNPQAS